MLRPSGADLHRMLHRVLWAIRTVVTPWRVLPPDPEREPPETPVSGEDLRQAELTVTPQRGALPPQW